MTQVHGKWEQSVACMVLFSVLLYGASSVTNRRLETICDRNNLEIKWTYNLGHFPFMHLYYLELRLILQTSKTFKLRC